MTFRNRFLFIAFCIVSLVALLLQWRNHFKQANVYDHPKQLSGKTDTIEVRHRNRDCDCPEWLLKTGGSGQTGEGKEEYLYIEAGAAGLEVPPAYWTLSDSGYVLRLTGQFYKGEAIPFDFTPKTDQKPQKARVFNYTGTEVVKPE